MSDAFAPIRTGQRESEISKSARGGKFGNSRCCPVTISIQIEGAELRGGDVRVAISRADGAARPFGRRDKMCDPPRESTHESRFALLRGG